MFAKLLVPVDGSEAALKAVAAAGEMARRFDSRVMLLHVQHLPEGLMAASGLAGMVALPEATVEALGQAGQEVLQAARTTLHVPEDRVTEAVLLGHPAETICRVAQEGGYDLIIMGRRGLSEVRGFLLGSVSDRVIHHAACPVLVVH